MYEFWKARTSYLPSEILWGHRFEQMQLYRKDNNKFEINFSAFHSTYEVLTPECCARQLAGRGGPAGAGRRRAAFLSRKEDSQSLLGRVGERLVTADNKGKEEQEEERLLGSNSEEAGVTVAEPSPL